MAAPHRHGRRLPARPVLSVGAALGHEGPPEALPSALAAAHRDLEVGATLQLRIADTSWTEAHLSAVIRAGAFEPGPLRSHGAQLRCEATAVRGLPDHVGPGMRLLCCGLNPSWHAADAGVGYVTGSNRFWRAMAQAGLATRDRDPHHLLAHDRIGMTDLVKRPTARADEVAADEFRDGLVRLDALCAWLRPAAVAMVGLQGWRAAVDRRASVGWQARQLGDRPVYVLPSTSGLNAGTSLDDLVAHLVAAADGPG